MDFPLINILVLSFIGSIAGLVGGIIFLIRKDWARILCTYAVPFAAGVLISVALLDLLPEAQEMKGEAALPIVLAALLGSFLFEQFVVHLHHHEGRRHLGLIASTPLVVVGDTVHNFLDGVAIAASYLTDVRFGIVVALATFLHETPHEIGDFGILMTSGWSRLKTFWVNVASAMATFPGALMVYYFGGGPNGKIGTLLAISAGVYLYLGASDFLPQLEEEDKGIVSIKKIIPLILGALTIYFMTSFLGV